MRNTTNRRNDEAMLTEISERNSGQIEIKSKELWQQDSSREEEKSHKIWINTGKRTQKQFHVEAKPRKKKKQDKPKFSKEEQMSISPPSKYRIK